MLALVLDPWEAKYTHILIMFYKKKSLIPKNRSPLRKSHISEYFIYSSFMILRFLINDFQIMFIKSY
jgi:hypothetical protein